MKHLAFVNKYLAIWAEPPVERDRFSPVPSLAEAADETPPDKKKPSLKDKDDAECAYCCKDRVEHPRRRRNRPERTPRL
jgi:hypothetical protein